MGMWELFGNLTKGEVTPLLGGQQNLETYYNGLASAKNMWGLPQGGQQKRHGQKFIDLATGNARLENFSFNTEQEYLMVFTATGCRIYKDDVALRTGTVDAYDDENEYAIGDLVSQIVTQADVADPRWTTDLVPSDTVGMVYQQQPVARNGKVYTLTEAKELKCVDEATGVVYWTVTALTVGVGAILQTMHSKIAVDDTGVYFVANDSASSNSYKLIKIDIDGVFDWATTGLKGTSGGENQQTPLIVEIDGVNYVYCQGSNSAGQSFFYCHRASDGIEMWECFISSATEYLIDGVPVYYYDATNDLDLILVGSLNGLWILDADPSWTSITVDGSTPSGMFLFHYNNVDVSRTPQVFNDDIYNGYESADLFYTHMVSEFNAIDSGSGYNRNTGFSYWNANPADGLVTPQPVWQGLTERDISIGDRVMGVGSHTSGFEGLWGVDMIGDVGAFPHKGRIIWGAIDNYNALTDIAHYNGYFFFGWVDGTDGKVSCVDAETGVLWWTATTLPNSAKPQSCGVAGKYLYIGDDKGYLHQYDMSLILLIGADAIFYVKADFVFWVDQTRYVANQLIMDGSNPNVKRYRCKVDHDSDGTIGTGNRPSDLTGNWADFWLVETDSFQPLIGVDYEHYFFLLESYAEDAILELPSKWTWAQIEQFDYIQSADTIIITHEDVPVVSIQRFSDQVWIIEDLVIQNIPQFDFADGLSPLPDSEIQTIIFPDSDQTGDRFKISLNGLLTEEIVYSREEDSVGGANATTTENNIRDALVRLSSTGNNADDIIVENIQITNSRRYQVTFSGGSANNWDLMAVSYVYASKATSPETRTERDEAGTSRKEDTWGINRGYPRTCTFHEGRLWFGGSRDRQNTIWGSRVFDYFNFWVGRAFPDESIEATLDTDQVNAINAIFSNRSLQVFTSGNEFYVPESPITPEKVEFSPQSNVGAKLVRPTTIDGITLFVQEEGKSIIQFVYIDASKANESTSISSSSEHLISNPKKLVVRRATTGRDANYVLILNSNGVLVVFNSMSSQGVAGFTPWETGQDRVGGSLINSVAVTDNYIYTLVERETNAGTIYCIEKEDETAYVDSAVTGVPSNIGGGIARLAGLDHLVGETVHIRADNTYWGEGVVDSQGYVFWAYTQDALPATATAGLLYLPEVIPMPLNVNLPNGVSAFSKKKIARVALNLLNSNGVRVNGMTYKEETDVNGVLVPLNGVHRKHVLGWTLEAQPVIDQVDPEPLLILSIGLEVAT